MYDDTKKLFEDEICCDFQIEGRQKTPLKAFVLFNEKRYRQDLPWGNLTGIRPAKIPGMLKEQGLSDEAIRKEMKETYFISDNKLDLAMDVSNMEHKVLSTNVNYKGNYSLYVGIPFCPTTCLYCSFTSYPLNRYKEKVDAYVDSVIKELRFLGKQLQDKELNSVYIGGGTPTTLEPAQLDRLVNALKDNFDFSNVKEFTVEAGRPDSITRDKLM